MLWQLNSCLSTDNVGVGQGNGSLTDLVFSSYSSCIHVYVGAISFSFHCVDVLIILICALYVLVVLFVLCSFLQVGRI